MEDRFDICRAFTLREEGGYVDDPADPGGATNIGDHLGDLSGMVRRPPSRRPPGQGHDAEDDESDLAIALLEPAARRRAPPGVDFSVFDMGVNAGIWRSARLLQRALGFTGDEVDGSIGPATLAAAGQARCSDPRE
jgi:lysozyme family protein